MKKNILCYAILSLAVLFFFFNINAVNAADPKTFDEGFKALKPSLGSDSALITLGGETETTILKKIINWLLSFVAILALVALISGGIMYIVSLGNESRAATAKKIILYAIIGLIVVGLSFSIIVAIETVFVGTP